MAEFVALQPSRTAGDKSWIVDAATVDPATWDLSVKNPRRKDETALRDPKDIIAEMRALDAETARILDRIEAML
jgi:type I restriction enzyme M protein